MLGVLKRLQVDTPLPTGWAIGVATLSKALTSSLVVWRLTSKTQSVMEEFTRGTRMANPARPTAP